MSKGWHGNPGLHAMAARGLRIKNFNAGLAIKQVGARPLTCRNHTYYELGGGLFTKKQILESRRREAVIKYGVKVPRTKVGL